MRAYEYSNRLQELFTPYICRLLCDLHEYRGKQILFLTAPTSVLNCLYKTAVYKSTVSAIQIERISISKRRIVKLLRMREEPLTYDEDKLVGYRNVITDIHKRYKSIPIEKDTILWLSQRLHDSYSYYPPEMWRDCDEIMYPCSDSTRYFSRPILPAFEIPYTAPLPKVGQLFLKRSV